MKVPEISAVRLELSAPVLENLKGLSVDSWQGIFRAALPNATVQIDVAPRLREASGEAR